MLVPGWPGLSGSLVCTELKWNSLYTVSLYQAKNCVLCQKNSSLLEPRFSWETFFGPIWRSYKRMRRKRMLKWNHQQLPRLLPHLLIHPPYHPLHISNTSHITFPIPNMNSHGTAPPIPLQRQPTPTTYPPPQYIIPYLLVTLEIAVPTSHSLLEAKVLLLQVLVPSNFGNSSWSSSLTSPVSPSSVGLEMDGSSKWWIQMRWQ